MYDQGSINSRNGESRNAPMQPPYQQRLPGPPPRPLLQQVQQGSPAQSYQFHQAPPFRMPNNLPFPGSSCLPSMYNSAQHRPSHFTALGPPNVLHNPIGTPPPLVPSQYQLRQTLYRAPLHPSSQQSVTQSLLILPPSYSRPPPPPLSYVSSAPLETNLNSMNPDSVPSLIPLPPANPPSSLASIFSVSPSTSITGVPSSNPSDEAKYEMHLRPSEKESSAHLHGSVTVAAAFSPCDSDMEMEDDIGQVDDEEVNHLVVKPEHIPVDDELFLNNQSASPNKSECKLEVRSSERANIAGYSDSGVHHNEAMKSECSPAIGHESFKSSAGNRADLQDIIVEKSTALDEGADARHLAVSDGRDSFRLVADYASDDNSEDDVRSHPQNTDCAPVPLSSASSSDCSKVTCFKPGKVDGISNSCKTGLQIHSGSSPSCKAPDPVDYGGAFTVSDTNRYDVDNNKPEIQHPCENSDASKDGLQNEIAGFNHSTKKFSKEHKKMGESMKNSSDRPKVDEFGRLVREAASDSDSDDSHYSRKNRRRRRRNQSHSHSRSRSISPIHRRRRRSPYLQGRRDRRARSRSLSPRYRRSRSRSPRRSRSRSPRKSRSRSPRFRRTYDLGGESRRWVKRRVPECFDFRRGKCYRGASCRFLHDGSNRNEDWRKQRLEKQHSLVSHGSKSNVDEEIKHVSDEVNVHGDVVVMSAEMTANSHLSAKREDSGCALLLGKQDDCGIPNSDLQTIGYGLQTGNQRLLGPTFLGCGNLMETKDFPSKSDNSSISVSSPQKTIASPSNDQPASITHPSMVQLQEHPSTKVSSALSHCKDLDGPQVAQPNHAPSAFYPSSQSLYPCRLANQQPYISTKPNSSLMSAPTQLQLPISTVNSEVATSSSYSRFQHYHLPRRDDYGCQVNSSSYLNQLPADSQVGEFQQARHPIMVNQNRPPMSVLPVYSMPSQQFHGSDPAVLTGPSAQNFMVSNSYPQGSIHSHAVGLVQEFQAIRNPTVSGVSLLPVGASSVSVYPCRQLQEPNHAVQHSLTHITQTHENIGNSLRYPPLTESNNSLVASSSSTYQNPYSYAIQPPTMSMLNTDALRIEKDATYPSFHAIADRQSIMSNVATSLPNSVKDTAPCIHGWDPNQYDPLVDSIEASAKTSRKHDRVQKWEASGDSDAILRFRISNEQLDAVGNRPKDVETVASAASVDSGDGDADADADAEVGAVESLSNSIGLEDAAGVEVEAKSPGKSKKSKDSRSVKLFKVALADFVKEVLRPSWRQGNMSKEAFKTIVKKTVDKVSGSMKGRRMPKSREKIDQYIESSQRKLTKLVMGYVDKYVKV